MTLRAKHLARQAGFDRVGIAPAARLPDQTLRDYSQWIASGFSARMGYLSQNQDLREDPGCLVSGARSVICLAVSYAPGKEDPPDAQARVARYARGRDYHKVLKKMGRRLMGDLSNLVGGFEGRCFTDSAPVMEKSLAVLAGLGWIGRHGCLIVPGLGSYVLLAEIISNLNLVADSPISGGCGACRLCIEACPTRALGGDGRVDARRCISYWNKGREADVPLWVAESMEGWICGCDQCQEVCPHNQQLEAGCEALLAGAVELPPIAEMLSWSREEYRQFVAGRGLKVVSYESMMRNLVCAARRAGDARLEGPLRELARRTEALSAWVDWALEALSEQRG